MKFKFIRTWVIGFQSVSNRRPRDWQSLALTNWATLAREVDTLCLFNLIPPEKKGIKCWNPISKNWGENCYLFLFSRVCLMEEYLTAPGWHYRTRRTVRFERTWTYWEEQSILEIRRRRRRFGTAMAGIIPTVSHLTKIGKMQSGGCQLCRRVREVCGESTDNLVVEIYGHINREGYQI